MKTNYTKQVGAAVGFERAIELALREREHRAGRVGFTAVYDRVPLAAELTADGRLVATFSGINNMANVTIREVLERR